MATTDPTPLGEPGAETRVRRLVLSGVTGAYLMPTMEIAVVQDGVGLAVKLEPQSARSLADALHTLADAKEPSR